MKRLLAGALWLFTLVVFPIPVGVLPYSFALEVLHLTRAVALPPGAPRVELTERVLVYLEKAEQKEIDPWLRDDVRIAWITANWAQYGIPEWAWLKDSPHAAATFQVLKCRPEEVWPRVLAKRQELLGALYPQVWGEQSSPRKPVRSVKLQDVLQKSRAA